MDKGNRGTSHLVKIMIYLFLALSTILSFVLRFTWKDELLLARCLIASFSTKGLAFKTVWEIRLEDIWEMESVCSASTVGKLRRGTVMYSIVRRDNGNDQFWL